jgi:hypothetical protein
MCDDQYSEKHVCNGCIQEIGEGRKRCQPKCDFVEPKDCYYCNRLAGYWRKMLDARQRKMERHLEKHRVKSLVECCCRIVASSPLAVLYLAQEECLPGDVWSMIKEYIPKKVNEDYKLFLLDEQEIGGRDKFESLGMLFSRFVTKSTHVSVNKQ